MEIFDASPQAKALIPEGLEPKADTNVSNAKYPFDRLPVGKCFLLPLDKGENYVRVLTSKNAKKLGKRFTVIKHAEHSVFEIARIG
jgi:hypothetical protein